jgi:hypothetical protein
MSADHDAAAAAHETTHAPQHVVETVDAQEPAALALPTPSISALLASPHIQRRGNGPVRQAAILQLQRTHGNRALQRLLKAQQTTNPAGGSAAARTLQRQPAAKQQEAPADQSGMETYLWVLDDVLDNHTSRLISNLGKYQEPFEKLFQALAAHDMAGKQIEGRQQREYFDEAVLGLAPILAHATAAQRAFLQRKRDELFQKEAFDRVENTAVVEGKAVEIPDDRHPHEQAEALRAVLPHLIENAQIANEQLLHLGHDQLEHALHELEEEGHGNVMSKLAALQTILGLANGWLTLTDEELQREINTVHGFFPTVTNFSELVKAIIEVGAGAVGVTALVAAAIAKAAGDAALASSAMWVAGEAGHALGNLVSGVEIVHGILVLLDPHATHAEKEKGALEAATGSAWFLGKRAAGAAGGIAATAAVILTYLGL